MEKRCGNCLGFDDEGYPSSCTGSCKKTGRDISKSNSACNEYIPKYKEADQTKKVCRECKSFDDEGYPSSCIGSCKRTRRDVSWSTSACMNYENKYQ